MQNKIIFAIIGALIIGIALMLIFSSNNSDNTNSNMNHTNTNTNSNRNSANQLERNQITQEDDSQQRGNRPNTENQQSGEGGREGVSNPLEDIPDIL